MKVTVHKDRSSGDVATFTMTESELLETFKEMKEYFDEVEKADSDED